MISSARFLKPKVPMHFAYLPCMLYALPSFVHPNSHGRWSRTLNPSILADEGNMQRHCVVSSNSRPSTEPQSYLSLVSVSRLSPIHTYSFSLNSRICTFTSICPFRTVLETKSSYAFRLFSVHASLDINKIERSTCIYN
jgi:hypothetical protein